MSQRTEDRGLKTVKGQLFSGDIAVATMVFLATLALAFFLWNSTTDDINRAENLRWLQKTAASTADQLIRSPGIPADWDTQWDLLGENRIGIIGLATSDRVINETKADSFIGLMNSTYYDDYKRLLGLGEYDFYIIVTELNDTDMSDTDIYVNGRPFIAGRAISVSEESVSVLRAAIFNGEIVRVNFIVWK